MSPVLFSRQTENPISAVMRRAFNAFMHKSLKEGANSVPVWMLDNTIVTMKVTKRFDTHVLLAGPDNELFGVVF